MKAFALLLLVATAACQSDGGTGPRLPNDPREIARNFEAISDSMSSAGNFDGAEVMHHVAEIVKLTNRVTPVEISVDGVLMRFLAVTEQMDYPIVQCLWPVDSTWPPSGGGSDSSWIGVDTVGTPFPCQPSETQYYSARTLIAWQPDSMHRIVRIVADTGPSRAPDEVPDVMAGLPTEVRVGVADSGAIPGDSGVVRPIFYPGFFGEYFERPEGWWVATQGTEANSLVSLNGACVRDTLELDWAKFSCERARIAFEVSMTVEPGFFCGFGETGPSSPRSSSAHKVEMRPQVVDGVRLRLVDYQPVPRDSTVVPPDSTVYLPATLDATVANGAVTLTFRILGDSARDVNIEFSSGQSYDFEIFGPDGSPAWRWSAAKGFTQVFQLVTLARGDTLTYVEKWSPPSGAAADYIAVAYLTSLNVQAAGKVGFRY